MSRPQTAEHDLLTRLGLTDGASEDEVENAHNDVVAFLENAPSELHAWARGQVAAADEAYALLSDRGAAIRERPTPARIAPPAKPAPAAPPTRRAKAHVQPQIEQPRPSLLNRIGPLGRIAIAITAIAGLMVGAYVVYASDLPSVPGLTGTPAPDASQATLDTARVAVLMQAIQTDPNDLAALQELGDLYFGVAQYDTAAQWEQRVLDVDPNNITGHLALGAAQYNLGNSADAESHWLRVVELNPNDTEALVEAHYDLGFMYFSANPPDVPKTIAEWQQVIALDPESDIAQTVSTHLATLEQWNASSSPSAGSPAASGSPAATPAPSATPAAVTPAPSAPPSPTAGQ